MRRFSGGNGSLRLVLWIVGISSLAGIVMTVQDSMTSPLVVIDRSDRPVKENSAPSPVGLELNMSVPGHLRSKRQRHIRNK